MKIKRSLISDPEGFMGTIKNYPGRFSLAFAEYLDSQDPLKFTKDFFEIGELIPFAGHSLGPAFKPAIEAIAAIYKLQREQLHAGHFPDTETLSGNWFDCDIEIEAIRAMQHILGFKHPSEFLYTQSGLSANLANLLDTFYKPSLKNWRQGKVLICHLKHEFISDQAIAFSVIKREIQRANNYEIFDDNNLPTENALILKLHPDQDGLYSAESIIETVKQHADKIQILHLSDIVFNTGQRLNISYILNQLKDMIKAHGIIVGLDLAHTVGNRMVNLADLEVVTYAVGCAYKYCAGTAGSGFGIYVNSKTDLDKYPPIQGWKAAKSDEVFLKINEFDSTIMITHGAWAFRTSNASPIALAPIKSYAKVMSAIGWNKLMAKSECLTRYMLALLKDRLDDKIQLITPEDPDQRGANWYFVSKS